MARKSSSDPKPAAAPPKRRSRAPKSAMVPLPNTSPSRGRIRRWIAYAALSAIGLFLALLLIFKLLPPPATPYMISEARAHGPITRHWVPLEEISPHMRRAALAAEDANFCTHWGLDLDAIRAAMTANSGGASTISQQVVKNLFLWHGHSWPRKALEAGMTPVVELVWNKRRILEVYLNIAEFDKGIFGVEAAAQHYFGTSAAALSLRQASLLAAILPNPKERSASKPSDFVNRRAGRIADGAATLAADGRAACVLRD